MEFTAYDVAIVPVVVALVGLFGKLGVPARWLPAISLVLGLAGGFVYVAPADPKQAALVGIVIGLSAIGVHSGVKNTVQTRE